MIRYIRYITRQPILSIEGVEWKNLTINIPILLGGYLYLHLILLTSIVIVNAHIYTYKLHTHKLHKHVHKLLIHLVLIEATVDSTSNH